MVRILIDIALSPKATHRNKTSAIKALQNVSKNNMDVLRTAVYLQELRTSSGRQRQLKNGAKPCRRNWTSGTANAPPDPSRRARPVARRVGLPAPDRSVRFARSGFSLPPVTRSSRNVPRDSGSPDSWKSFTSTPPPSVRSCQRSPTTTRCRGQRYDGVDDDEPDLACSND